MSWSNITVECLDLELIIEDELSLVYINILRVSVPENMPLDEDVDAIYLLSGSDCIPDTYRLMRTIQKWKRWESHA